MKYLNEFLKMKCAGDILNISNPIQGVVKEIEEGMGIRSILRSIVLKHPMKYRIIEFCAGNALPSILSVFSLPVKSAIAYDKRPRKRDWNLINRFTYSFEDIYEFDPQKIEETDIIISCHPCGQLAERVIEIYNQSPSRHLILCPCCNGKIKNEINNELQWVRSKITKYDLWTAHLGRKIKGSITYKTDIELSSPKNNIIISSMG
jgi:hypothetical protein